MGILAGCEPAKNCNPRCNAETRTSKPSRPQEVIFLKIKEIHIIFIKRKQTSNKQKYSLSRFDVIIIKSLITYLLFDWRDYPELVEHNWVLNGKPISNGFQYHSNRTIHFLYTFPINIYVCMCSEIVQLYIILSHDKYYFNT